MKIWYSALVLLVFALAACGGGDKPKQSAAPAAPSPEEQMLAEGKGIGEVKSVELKTPLEAERVSRGKAIYDMKCSACHKLDDKRVVGPGWKNVTKNRKPEWIMNMITNVDVMLERDNEAQKLLELCLTRMPNQNVSIGDARDVLEFMRSNDGEK
ncbi:MAG: cytochrome c [Saprospiraceae bacterium]|jgi:mono/diheme cytochrome c family protein|nr:cytochrome c [Saprospiraceae bacterium]